jgi:histone H3/H4
MSKVNNKATKVEQVVETSAPVETVEVVADKKTRVRLNEYLSTYISAARVRRNVDDKGLNKLNEDMMNELKASISEYLTKEKALKEESTSAEDKLAFAKYVEENKDRFADVDKQLKALSKDRIRFSNNASVILAILCDAFVKELAVFAMKNTVKSDKKNVYVSHLHQAGVEHLSLYSLFGNLPTFVAMSKRTMFENTLSADSEIMKKKLVQVEKEFKKKYNVQLTKEQRAKNKADKLASLSQTPVVADTTDDVQEKEDITTYRYYINKLFNDNKPASSSLRITNEIKMYLSKLIDEFLERVSDQVRLTIITMKNKTINEKAILHNIKSMLIVGHQVVETLELVKKDEGYEVVHKRTYPTSGYNELKESINSCIEKFKEFHTGVAV